MKECCLKLQSIQDSFVLLFLLSNELVDSMDNYKSLNINIVTVMKNPEMLKFVLDHPKTKKMCRHAVKKLPYLLRYVPDQYNLNKFVIKLI